MNVLVVNWRDIKNPEAGGAEVHIDEILKRKPKDWNVDFVSAAYSKSCIRYPDFEMINGYRVFRIPNNLLFNFTFRYYYKKYLHNNNYDLIIDDVSKIPLAIPNYIKDKKIITIIHHIHGLSLFSILFSPIALYVFLMEKLLLTFYKKITVICVSKSTYNEINKKYGNERIAIIHNGIEYKRIRELSAPFKKSDTPVFTYIGRLKKYKRVQHVIRAFKEYIDKTNDTSSVVWIAGRGDYEKELKKYAGSLNISNRVIFHGFVTEEKKIELLTMSWVSLIASEKEGWGITVIESNACGTPVVGFDSDGLRDSIKDAVTGYIVKNTSEMADKMAAIVADKKVRDELSGNAVTWASEFDLDTTTKFFFKAVDSI